MVGAYIVSLPRNLGFRHNFVLSQHCMHSQSQNIKPQQTARSSFGGIVIHPKNEYCN
ncbi:unnamed protein product [Rhodiola kirilowii]